MFDVFNNIDVTFTTENNTVWNFLQTRYVQKSFGLKIGEYKHEIYI